MNILVLSNTAWNKDNSFGNSFSNIFEGIPNIKFANIYCRTGEPDNGFDMQYFQITEKSLIDNLRYKHIPSGRIVYHQDSTNLERENLNKYEVPGFSQASKMRWQIMFWARDCIWKFGRWKSVQLLRFIDDFKPDLIFQPVYIKPYINDIALFIKKYTNVPMIGYISDDNYTLKQYRLSPLYWIDRLYNRRKVREVIEQCKLLYVISDIQKKEYEEIFTPPCKVLTKCADFTKTLPKWPLPNKKISLIYAGNLGTGRWKSLGLISKVIERLQNENYLITLDVYSSTPQTKRIKKELHKRGTTLHGAVPYKYILDLEQQADILVHVEGLEKKNRLEVHQSFSTKLVDFFELGKCIFAIGTEDEASIYHLIKNDAAIVAKNEDEIYKKLKYIVMHPEIVLEYGEKAFLCGAKNHNKLYIQRMLMQDIEKVITERGK